MDDLLRQPEFALFVSDLIQQTSGFGTLGQEVSCEASELQVRSEQAAVNLEGASASLAKLSGRVASQPCSHLGLLMHDIVPKTGAVAQMVGDVNHAGQEQAAGISLINAAVTRLGRGRAPSSRRSPLLCQAELGRFDPIAVRIPESE